MGEDARDVNRRQRRMSVLPKHRQHQADPRHTSCLRSRRDLRPRPKEIDMPTELIKRWNTWGFKGTLCGLAGLAMVALPGCGSSRPADVPRSAMLKTEGD